MQAYTSNLSISFDFQDLLKGITRLDTNEIEQLAHAIQQILEERNQREHDLIQQIQTTGPDQSFQERLQHLAQKNLTTTITATEHQELLQMIPIAENWAANRLQYLIELSQLWNTSVDETMQRLNITTPPIIHG